ncbi:MAG: hypothetical protein M3P28_06585 [Thermoproteota archaeon]|nr:hypothetical protein [Thermoproteota archaeon]
MPTLRESGFCFLQAQALSNNSNTTVANSTQISTNGTAANDTQILKTVQITVADSKAPTDGNSVNIDIQIQPFPITKNVDSQFMISFLQPSSQALQVHVDYDFAITNNKNEVFRASSITGQPLLHTAEGIVKIPYKFTQDGQYSLQVSVMGINFIPIKTEQALFDLNVS